MYEYRLLIPPRALFTHPSNFQKSHSLNKKVMNLTVNMLLNLKTDNTTDSEFIAILFHTRLTSTTLSPTTLH